MATSSSGCDRPRGSLGEHAALSALFFLGRILFDVAGLKLNFVLDWMALADPEDLRTQLLYTAYYAHSSPPGMNLLTGWVLKLGGAHAAVLAHAVILVAGLVLVNALFHLLRALELGRGAALAIATAFSLTPASLFFEHLYLYSVPTAALLALSAVLFHRAVVRRSRGAWLGFFLVCAAIGWLRSTFHLVWFAGMIGLACWYARPDGWRTVLAGAAAPAMLLLALYVKNLLVFGVFGATSYAPVNLTQVTVRRMPPSERTAWVREGRLSPYAAIDVFSGPEAYLPLFQSSEDPHWPPPLNQLERPSIHRPNFNHWFYLRVNPQRARDAMAYLSARPAEYAQSVLFNLAAFFSPSTKWHPWDGTPRSPHTQHREVLGRYESAWNAIVHRVPFAPVGLYALLPLPLAWVVRHARRLARAGSPAARARGALCAYCLVQIGYVVAVSIFLTYLEMARYRFMIEAMLWLIVALAARRLLRGRTSPADPAETSPSAAPAARG
jgi:hypothetical protein